VVCELIDRFAWVIRFGRNRFDGTYDDTIVFDLRSRTDLSSLDDTPLADRDEIAHLHRIIVE
jgi:hypothetical protein